jgi:Leucine-rich repeat (LRR) protein
LKQLKKINLEYNDLSRIGNEALARFNLIQNIKVLNLSGRFNEVGSLIYGDFGVMVFLASPYVFKVKTLDLSESNLTDSSAIAISKSTKFSQLFELNLSGNKITDLGASALANSKYFKQLKKLNLNFNSIGDLGASSIAESPYMTNLEYLKLGQNRVGKAGAKALKKSNTLINLIYPIFGFY